MQSSNPLENLQKTLQFIFQNSNDSSQSQKYPSLPIISNSSITIKASLHNQNYLKIQQSQPLQSASEELQPFLNKYIYNSLNTSFPFHLELIPHSLKLKSLRTLAKDYISNPLIQVTCKEDPNQVFFFKVFSSNQDQSDLKIALAIINYIQASYSQHQEAVKTLPSPFDSPPSASFVNFSGLGRDLIAIKESWFMSLFKNEYFLQESPLLWAISEPGLCDLRTFLNTVKKIKFQIPLYFGWMFLVKFVQILKYLKDLSLAHLDIRSECLFIQASQTEPWTFYEGKEECIKALKRLDFLKLGEFYSAKLTTAQGENASFSYRQDVYAMGIILKEIQDNMDEKYYGYVFDKTNEKHVLQEKTKGLLKELIAKMTEPDPQITIETLWNIVSEHTTTLISHNPSCFEYKKQRSGSIPLSSQYSSEEIPVAIFHAFNMKYHQIDEVLIKKVKELGFSHIQISPTQKSHEYMAWHDKYQPRDYKVKNRYGNAEDLTKLAERVHKYGLKLIADVVFNHMGSITWFNHITRDKFHNDKKGYSKYRKDLVNAYSDVFKPKGSTNDPDYYFTEWNEEGWMGGSLPQLNTLHPDVKNVQITYLKLLRSLGVDGFRFDAIKTIDKQSLRDYVAAVGDKWLYGELCSGDVKQNHEFTPIMPITDFVLLNHLLGVFCISGSLRNLRVPATNWDPRSVIFAVNHDTWAAKKSRHLGINMTFSEESDSDLATLFILARHGGVPLLLESDTWKPSVQAGVKFRREMWNRQAAVEGFNDEVEIFQGCNLDTFMVMQRGSEGIFILNKDGEDVKVEEADVSGYWCIPGYYVDAETGKLWRVYEKDGRKYLVNEKGVFCVGKRSGVFLIRMNNM